MGKRPMPVHVLLRHLLGCGDVRQACAVARSLTHGASSNRADCRQRRQRRKHRVPPRGVAIIKPDGGTLAHTNHFLDPALAVHAAPLNALATTEQARLRASPCRR
jgi:isopenicillin-N N-acyltransferase-like protein